MIASLSFDVVVVSSLLPWRLRNCCRCQLMKHRSFSIFGREELLEFPRVQFFDWSQLGMLCGSVDRKGIGAEKAPCMSGDSNYRAIEIEAVPPLRISRPCCKVKVEVEERRFKIMCVQKSPIFVVVVVIIVELV